VELLGRPLADARLVSFAYDYEQSTHPRHAPSTTPALVNGRAPVPVAYSATARRAGTAVRGTFAFDPTRRTLTYDVRVAGTPAARVSVIALARDSAGHPGPIIRRLATSGNTSARGALVLGEIDRQSLRAGRLTLAVFSVGQAGIAAPLVALASPSR
jgi:amidase